MASLLQFALTPEERGGVVYPVSGNRLRGRSIATAHSGGLGGPGAKTHRGPGGETKRGRAEKRGVFMAKQGCLVISGLAMVLAWTPAAVGGEFVYRAASVCNSPQCTSETLYLYGYSVSVSTGTLTPVPGSPVALEGPM